MRSGAAPTRRVELESVFNLRDIGGYLAAGGKIVRRSLVYRADGLYRLAGDDVDQVAALGLRTVIDLRTPGELVERGRFPVEAIAVEYHHLPVLETTWDPAALAVESPASEFLSARYLDMLHEGGPAIAETLRLIADPTNHPLVFHSAAGKDRTGVVAALVLSLLGVGDDDVAADYAASGEAMDRMVAWVRDHVPEGVERMARQPAVFLHAPAEAIRFFLDLVRAQFGSIGTWAVEEAGVEPATVVGLRNALLAER